MSCLFSYRYSIVQKSCHLITFITNLIINNYFMNSTWNCWIVDKRVYSSHSQDRRKEIGIAVSVSALKMVHVSECGASELLSPKGCCVLVWLLSLKTWRFPQNRWLCGKKGNDFLIFFICSCVFFFLANM